jgi:hypothetical protein
MFYQNSNDLVKNASNQSGHIQNSSETRQIITAQVNNNRGLLNSEAAAGASGAGAARAASVSASAPAPDDNNKSASLDFGTKFLNQVQSLFSLKEGNTNQEDVVVNNVSKDVAKNGDIELAQLDKEKGIMDLIQKQDEITRKQWAEVTDTAGVSLFGYITQNGIFQIGDIARSSKGVSTSWLDTYRMKNNAGVIGCPKPDAFKKYNVAGKWSDYKMFDMIYDVGDTAKSKPLFMITANVRDHRSAYERDGIFACGNEGKNVYVKERPSAVFQMTETDESVEPGCYIFNDNVNDNELRHRGFSLQNDLTASSIAQCKRRAEDLGRTHFLLTPPNPGNLENTGRCWVYNRPGDKPNLAGVMKLDKTGNACHKLANREEGEDEIMANYSTADLPRLYGKVKQIPDPDKPLPNPECDHKTRNGCIFEDYKHVGNGRCVPQSKTKPDEHAACPFWARIGECGKNPGYMLYRCQTSCKVRDENELRKWTYDGLYTYNNEQLKGWLKALHERNGSGVERDAVNKYIEKCKGTKGYTFLDDNYVQPTKPQVAGALYTLKKYGPTGVNLGPVGKIAYIDHNGERHNYPESALSYLKPGTYVEMAGYDTRSAESSYNIEEAQTKRVELSIMYGPSMSGREIPAEIKFLDDGNHVYIVEDGPFTKMVSSDGIEKYYTGSMSQFNPASWNNYSIMGKGGYLLRKTGKYKDFTIVAKGQPITNSIDQCRQLCDANEKCGGYVFTKGTTDSNGKCELKDREKMFPNGLRIADRTKQFFIKVPTINSTMKDDKCITANQVSGDGEVYKAINSAQYSFYPDGGAMTPDFKCDMKSHIPKGPGTVPVNLSVIYDAVDGAVASTTNSTNTYKQQTSMKEGFEDKASFEAGTYGQAIKGVGNTLKTIANSKYQRERLLALTEESNKTLISESYKFILWSILAILTVLALLKLKEMFGQEDADDSNDGAGGDAAGGGLLATILGWFGAGSIKTDDIPDRTEEVKAALSSAGNKLKESGEQLANSVTEGADNLVKSANEAAAGAVEGATNLVDKAKETASNAIDRIGTATAAAAPAAAPAPPPSGATTGGKSTRKK